MIYSRGKLDILIRMVQEAVATPHATALVDMGEGLRRRMLWF